MAKKNQTTGNCKHCGQSMIIHLPDGWDPADKTQEDYDQLATEQCECEQALTAAERQQKKKEAVRRMHQFYDELFLEIKGQSLEAEKEREILDAQRCLMVNAIGAVADRKVHAVQVQLTLSSMFSVAVKANGDLQIKRIYKGMEEWLF